MEEKAKKKTTFWLPPDMIDRMDSWLKADNCRSRNEFVEKALRFYMGYLGTEDNTAYLSQAILTAIQGTLEEDVYKRQALVRWDRTSSRSSMRFRHSQTW